MKAAVVFAGSGPLVILTSHDSLQAPALRNKLASKGIEKFIAYELPVDTVRRKYGEHFTVVCEDLHQTDDLRVLDFNGHRAMELLSFRELDLAHPVLHEV